MSNEQWLAFIGGALVVLIPGIVASWASIRAANAQIASAERIAASALGAADRAAAAAEASAETASRTAIAVAEQTLQGQRVLTRDAALRDARRIAVSQILATIDSRLLTFSGAVNTLEQRGGQDVAPTLEELQHGSPTSFAHLAIPHEGFKAALTRCGAADSNAVIALRRYAARPSGDDVAPYLTELIAAVNLMREAVIELHSVGVEYWIELQ